jgi:hypothetical protein
LSSRLFSKNPEIKIYKTIIILLLLYGCETWSLTLREEHRLRVFEPKTKVVAGGRKSVHKEEFHDLCASPDILRMITWMEHVARMGVIEIHTFWLESPKGRDHFQDIGIDGRIMRE